MITFWRALAMLVLCRILFGGVHGRGWHGSRRPWGRRWSNLSDEERAKFREAVRNKWASARRRAKDTRRDSASGRVERPGAFLTV